MQARRKISAIPRKDMTWPMATPGWTPVGGFVEAHKYEANGRGRGRRAGQTQTNKRVDMPARDPGSVELRWAWKGFSMVVDLWASEGTLGGQECPWN